MKRPCASLWRQTQSLTRFVTNTARSAGCWTGSRWRPTAQGSPSRAGRRTADAHRGISATIGASPRVAGCETAWSTPLRRAALSVQLSAALGWHRAIPMMRLEESGKTAACTASSAGVTSPFLPRAARVIPSCHAHSSQLIGNVIAAHPFGRIEARKQSLPSRGVDVSRHSAARRRRRDPVATPYKARAAGNGLAYLHSQILAVQFGPNRSSDSPAQ
jgi:hypothetical protein